MKAINYINCLSGSFLLHTSIAGIFSPYISVCSTLLSINASLTVCETVALCSTSYTHISESVPVPSAFTFMSINGILRISAN